MLQCETQRWRETIKKKPDGLGGEDQRTKIGVCKIGQQAKSQFPFDEDTLQQIKQYQTADRTQRLVKELCNTHLMTAGELPLPQHQETRQQLRATTTDETAETARKLRLLSEHIQDRCARVHERVCTYVRAISASHISSPYGMDALHRT